MTCLFCGNVEGADLKQNNQSTTHIDPYRPHVVSRKAGKYRAYRHLPVACSVSDKGPSLGLNTLNKKLVKVGPWGAAPIKSGVASWSVI